MALNRTDEWRVELSKTWDVLGPFPIHAREQHFLSPSFPLDLSHQIDLAKTWPSSYADGGMVSWSQFQAAADGELKVSFPAIRWNALRATEGWAALQYHAVLRTSLTLHPPQDVSKQIPCLRLRVELKRGAFFALVPSYQRQETQSRPLIPEWHPGNIYDMEKAVPATVNLPLPPSIKEPTTYDIFISGDYEIRLFGDPRTQRSELPVLSISLSVNVEHPSHLVVHEPSHDVICDFVDGYAFGSAIGIGLRSVSGWWTLDGIGFAEGTIDGVVLELLHYIRIAPTQTRIVPIRIAQTMPFFLNEIRVCLTLVSVSVSTTVSVVLPVNHVPCWTISDYIPLKASYFYVGLMPTYYLAIPPIHANTRDPHPPILALHGAGVDIITNTFWAYSIPRQNHSWIILPTGLTSWGLDWHGPSAKDACATVDALVVTLEGNSQWHSWRLAKDSPVIVMGHSNGGQGSWYLGSRYPDKVIAVIAAAAYIKSQAYIPLTMSRSAHFIDPALRAILDSALTPDDNDLFLSNLVDTPVLAIHGGCDDNVPTWHSREAVSVLRCWQPNGNVTLQEDKLQPHWYPSVLNNAKVQAFLDSIFESPKWVRSRSKSFTVTVAAVEESGSLHGWRIESLVVPGRLSRLHVEDRDGVFHVTTNNVHIFSVQQYEISELEIDGAVVSAIRSDDGALRFIRTTGSRNWTAATAENLTMTTISAHPPGRIQSILTSTAPLAIVIPQRGQTREFSVALRIAHSLDIYHKLDVDIFDSSEALDRIRNGILGLGNVIVIGDITTPFVQWALAAKRTPFQIDGTTMFMNGRPLTQPGLGILFMHPHPTVCTARMLFILANDPSGIERAARLFPFRTGISVPDWLIVSGVADDIGAAGIVGAGVWDRKWQWNREMSWLY